MAISSKIYVAMSGGVDSSVAAALLKKRDFNVVGVFMKPWQPKGIICMWKQDREDAMRAAAVLNIPFKTWDFSKEYKKSVADYMIREYRVGRTPNPDVICNKEIKFGLFLKKALKEGANYIATGHYIKLTPHPLVPTRTRSSAPAAAAALSQPSAEPSPRASERLRWDIGGSEFRLFQARDKNKDQSYFLWTLTQKELKHCLFPIGDYTKPEVRKLAKKFGLPNHAKKDSQGVCFIGPLDMKEFLVSKIKPKKGNILNRKDKIIGQHDGVFYYTIGQRHGLDIKGGHGPYYVLEKDIKKNIIVVGEEKDLGQIKTKVEKIQWVNGGPPAGGKLPAVLDIKVRYRTPSHKAVLKKDGSLEFKKPERAITSGQSAVFYRAHELLGGGIIK